MEIATVAAAFTILIVALIVMFWRGGKDAAKTDAEPAQPPSRATSSYREYSFQEPAAKGITGRRVG